MRALNKDTLREIKKSRGRFLSILLMIAIGVLVFIGLKITGPAMNEKADSFFQKTKGADIVVTSTYGLEDEDINTIKKASGIKDIELGYTFDVETTKNDELIRLNSLTKKVNKVDIVKGKMPKSENEILLDYKLNEKYSVGDSISFKREDIDKEKDEKYSIKNRKFKIVGFVKSPDYVDAINLGSSNIGDGKVTGIGFIEKSVFDLDSYSTVKITFKDLTNLKFSEEKYKELAKSHKKEVEKLLSSRKDEAFKDKKNEVAKEISDGEKELTDAKEKLKNAEIELKDGKQKLEDGYKEYNDGKTKLEEETSKAKSKLDNAQKEIDLNKKVIEVKKETLVNGEKELAKVKEQVDFGRSELDKALGEYNTNKNLLEGAISKYNDEINKMNSQLKEINDTLALIPSIPGQIAELESQLSNLETRKQQVSTNIETKNTELAQVNTEIAETENSLQQDPENQELLDKLNQLKAKKTSIQTSINTLQTELSGIESKIANLKTNIEKLNGILQSEPTLKENKQKLEAGIKQANTEKSGYEDNLNKLLAGKSVLDEKEKEWQTGKDKYDVAVSTIESGKKQLADGELEIQKAQGQINSGKATLEAELQKGKAELATALKELDKNKNKLEDSEKEFLEEKEKAEKEILDGEKDLEDARRILKVLEAPRYTVDSRESNQIIYTFYDEARRLGIISNIFPVFFFFIALLVSLTTMTRMVDEDRLQIGTLKALGYSNNQIIKKYFIYGGLASVLGCVLGIIIGHTIISPLIFYAYSSNYVFYSPVIPFNVLYSTASLMIGVLCTAVAGSVASKSSLRENASALMRGKPPKSGTRILLERIKFVWKRLSFMEKVTMRNLFRYKRRMFMTIIGISGCTGLIFMGFGIKDSITSMEQKQYHEILNYDIVSIYDQDFSPEGYKDYEKLIANKEKVKNSSPVVIDSLKIDVKNAPDQDVTMLVPKEKGNINKFINLRNRKSKDKINISNNGVVITEKAARVLDVKEGDKVKVKDSNNEEVTVKITSIAENYSGHYMYMSKSYYEEVFEKEYKANGDILKLNTEDAKVRSSITEEINNNDSVLSIFNNSQVRDMIDTLLGTLDILVFVIIVCSCVLAFVVLYNLTNINVSERLRELSTIKVLGFYDKEVTAYVYRETFILTILGIVLGYVIGFSMHYIIINNLVPDVVMLDPHLFLLNYILSGFITVAFAVVVMVVIHRKLKNINMVEALKAVE